MPSIITLKNTIRRTRKQIRKQKSKLIHSQDLAPKLAAKDELGRLKERLSRLEITLEQELLMIESRKEDATTS